MEFISANKIRTELLNSFDEAMTLEIVKRPEKENYTSPYDVLKDWYLLRALAINRTESIFDYINLLEQESLDEN